MDPPAPIAPPNEGASQQLRLERRLAEAALEHYGLRGARLQLLRRRPRQQATTFRVLSPSRERFALKLYGVRQGGEQQAGSPALRRTSAKVRFLEIRRSQLLWLSALGQETDLLVPEPVPMNDGSLLGEVSLEYPTQRRRRASRALLGWVSRWGKEDLDGALAPCSRNFVLMRWVPGKNKRHDLKPKDVSLIGSYVARLHRHAEGYEIPEGSALLRWGWEWPFGENKPLWSKGEAFYSSSDMDGFRTAAQRVWEDLEGLGESSKVFGVTHRDLHLGNLVFGRDTVGAIDFDLCGLSHYLYDLSKVRTSLRRHHTGRVEPLWAAFLEGYERERVLQEDYQQYLTTFDVMREVAAVNSELVIPGSGKAGGRSQGPEFLANAASWLKDLSWR